MRCTRRPGAARRRRMSTVNKVDAATSSQRSLSAMQACQPIAPAGAMNFVLLPLDFARRDHALPLADFALDVGAHFRRAARSRFTAELDEALARIGIGERLAHLGVPPPVDRLRRAAGRAEA